MRGKISAWGALAAGLGFVLLTVMQMRGHAELEAACSAIVAVLLLAGGFRTLRQSSGGLRLLAGSWGVAAGMLMSPAWQTGSIRNAVFDFGPLALTVLVMLPAIPLAGIALTALHKEQKR